MDIADGSVTTTCYTTRLVYRGSTIQAAEGQHQQHHQLDLRGGLMTVGADSWSRSSPGRKKSWISDHTGREVVEQSFDADLVPIEELCWVLGGWRCWLNPGWQDKIKMSVRM
jgi:hypothetical protein